MEGRSFCRLRLSLLLALLLALLSTACESNGSVPTTLMDGSRASPPGIELEEVSDPVVLTKARIVRAEAVPAESLAAACLRGVARAAHPKGLIVERIGANSETVTLRDESGLYACDDSPGLREANRRWCGGAFGKLRDEHLRDPRLSISCKTRDGDLIGFVWIAPGAKTQYVAVAQDTFSEVYEVGGDLPIRVATTSDVEIEGSRAAFDVSEHDVSGTLLRRYRLESAVAG
ncbi:hypothetical protein BH09ACT13_BH09ACT13_04050 [soil metagenome]